MTGVALPLSPSQGAFTSAQAAPKRCRKALTCRAQSNVSTLEEKAGSSNGVFDEAPRSLYNTGASDMTKPGPLSLIDHEIAHEKTVVFVRHGMTTWNEQKRIQGDSDESTLTPFGEEQARRTAAALSKMQFDSCYTSPIRRASRFAELTWGSRQAPLIKMPTLKEAHLGWLQGMSQDEASQTGEGVSWRQAPSDFGIGGRYPVKEVFSAAYEAWKDILEADGTQHLVVTHKSILRALLCVALNLPPVSFRAFDIHNAGVCTFRVNKRGEPMLSSLNLTSHLHHDGVFY
ncbi:g9875 [Coccomyxa viridis]|uniref:G9875 protein n=1 Tax=Coccomyxa viridis TaxID=1274662 RepID=A0ABP1G5D1_9CHLO